MGQFRANDPDTLTPIDAAGQLPDGTAINGPDDLRRALVARPDHQFVQAFTENLMTYALGRSLDYRDMPTVRRIVRQAAADDYRFKSIVLGVVSSDAFRKTGSRQTHRPPAPAKHARSKSTSDWRTLVMFLTRKASVTAHRPQGRRRDHRAAVAGCHDPGRNGAGADRRGSQPAPGLRLLPAWRAAGRMAPTQTGRDFEFPFILKPLEPLREHVTVVSGLRNKGGESSSPHGIIEETWLNCVSPRQRNAKTGVGVTVDQIAARHLGKDTSLPSLELCGEPGGMISFRTPEQPLPMESNPRKVFYGMFGQGDTQRRTPGHSEHDGQPARLREGIDGQPEPQARCRRPGPGERLPGFGPRDRAPRAEARGRTPSRWPICRMRRSVRRRISASSSTFSSR